MLHHVSLLVFIVSLINAESAPPDNIPFTTTSLPATTAKFVVKDAPTYRDTVIQASDPTKLADPTLATYVKPSASYRVNGAPAPSTPNLPPPPQNRVIESDFRVPNNSEGVVQNITVVLPSNNHMPSKQFYDQLAQGKTPRKSC